MLGRIILGGIFTVIGVIFALKTEWFLKNIGPMEWADKYLGAGGSRFGYKLIGILAIVIGILTMTGLFGPLIMALLGKVFKGAAG